MRLFGQGFSVVPAPALVWRPRVSDTVDRHYSLCQLCQFLFRQWGHRKRGHGIKTRIVVVPYVLAHELPLALVDKARRHCIERESWEVTVKKPKQIPESGERVPDGQSDYRSHPRTHRRAAPTLSCLRVAQVNLGRLARPMPVGSLGDSGRRCLLNPRRTSNQDGHRESMVEGQ